MQNLQKGQRTQLEILKEQADLDKVNRVVTEMEKVRKIALTKL